MKNEIKKLIPLTDEEIDELENLRQLKKAREPIRLPSLVPALPKYQQLPEIFSYGEIQKIIETIEKTKTLYNDNYGDFRRNRDLAMVSLNYFLALRPSEVVMLRFTDIKQDDDGNYSLVIRPDSNKIQTSRIVPIPKQVIPVLQRWLQFRGASPFLFPTMTGGHISRDHYRTSFKKILEEAGLYSRPIRGTHGHRTLYTLRHSRATHLMDSGANIFQVQQLLGHKSLEITAVYLHQTQKFKSNLREVLEL